VKYCDITKDPINCLLPDGTPLSRAKTIDCIASYLAVMCGIRMMSPRSIMTVYLPGIATTFDMMSIENEFRPASQSPMIKLILRGFTKSYDYRFPAKGKVKIAFGMDLALLSKIIMSRNEGPKSYYDCDPHSSRADVIRERMFLVMAVGIMFLLRCSEHIKSKPNTRASPVTRQHFVFWDAAGRRISYAMIGRVEADIVMIAVDFTKTDQSGYGRRVTHKRQADHPTVCIVCLLEHYIQLTRDNYGATAAMEIYFIPGFVKIQLDDLHRLMHSTVLHKLRETAGAGETPSPLIKATSHSLRYGGATMMAAAGYPQYMIAIYGGWSENSTALRIYTKTSDEMVNRVSRHMVLLAKENPSMQFLRELVVK
jgi:Phage integrase family